MEKDETTLKTAPLVGGFAKRIGDIAQEFSRNRKFISGFAVFGALLLTSVIGGRLMPGEYSRIGRFPIENPPSQQHPLGTDSMGRDILALIFTGIENSLKVGLLVAVLGTFMGSTIGFISGYYGGSVDGVIRVFIDVFLSVPSILFLILLGSFVKVVGVWQLGIIIGVFSWASAARQSRAQTLSLKERDFVYVARLSGIGTLEIVLTDLMPHMAQWMGASFINGFLTGILAESGLAMLGLGAQNEMTLGMMLFWANSYAALYKGLWWWWSSVVITLILLFVSLYIMHIGLDEIGDPRLRAKKER